ncbi:MAG: Ig-like domain-containing protein, partial [Acidimicrobiia bacterium]|nr:Ig-like domain-containing protein [Acidimicrobiia bacterium]
TATATIEVLSVNDSPVAKIDFIVVDSYAEIVIPVLFNDFDPENDTLTVTSVFGRPHGSVVMHLDGTVSYTPRPGFVGTDVLTYTLIDGQGGVSQADIVITVTRAALDTATDLGDSVGTDLGSIAGQSIGPITSIPGLELLSSAFFQSLETLRVPLIFLGLALLWAMVLSLRWVRLLPFLGGSKRLWSIVMLDRESMLPVHEEADPNSGTVYSFAPTSRYIRSIGRPHQAFGKVWIQVETPAGNGWVDSFYLTQQLSTQAFVDDERPEALAKRLADALAASAPLGKAVAPRGLYVIYGAGHAPIHMGDMNDPALLDEQRVWPAGGTESISGSFRQMVAAPFIAEHSGHGRESYADNPTLVSALIPTYFFNFHYRSFGEPGSLNSWMVFYEYIGGKAYIVGMVVDR